MGALTTSFVLFQARLPVFKYSRILEGRRGSRGQTDQSATVHQSLSQSDGHDGKHSYYRANGWSGQTYTASAPVCHGKSQIERTRTYGAHKTVISPHFLHEAQNSCTLLPVLLHFHGYTIRRPSIPLGHGPYRLRRDDVEHTRADELMYWWWTAALPTV